MCGEVEYGWRGLTTHVDAAATEVLAGGGASRGGVDAVGPRAGEWACEKVYTCERMVLHAVR